MYKKTRKEHRREPRCSICRRATPDARCLDACYDCYMHALEMQLRAIPSYPAVLSNNHGVVCEICEIAWPAEFRFPDSGGRSKCVLCRKFELINKVEMTPGVMIIFTLGEGRRVRCLGCEHKSDPADFTVDLGRDASWKTMAYRISMFCGTCRRRGLEERLAAQGLVNTDS